MYDFNELLTRIDELQILIIKVAEVASLVIICVVGVRHQMKRLNKKKKRSVRKEPKQSDGVKG